MIAARIPCGSTRCTTHRQTNIATDAGIQHIDVHIDGQKISLSCRIPTDTEVTTHVWKGTIEEFATSANHLPKVARDWTQRVIDLHSQ